MLNFSRLIASIVVCSAAAPSYAQAVSNARGTFLDVQAGPDWDDAQNNSTRVPGATFGTGLAFGFDRGTSGVEFDVDVPQWHTKNGGPDRYQYVGPSFGYEQQGHFYESSWTVRRRSIQMALLRRGNVKVNRHATFTWLVGGAYVIRPEQSTSVTKEVLPDGQLRQVNTNDGTSFRNYLAATARLDVELTIASHMSIVPRLRVTAFPSLLDDSGLAPRMLVAQPEIAWRWRF